MRRIQVHPDVLQRREDEVIEDAGEVVCDVERGEFREEEWGLGRVGLGVWMCDPDVLQVRALVEEAEVVELAVAHG